MIKTIINKTGILMMLLFVWATMVGAPHYDIIVSQDGTGDYTTLSEAIAKLPMYQYERAVVFVKNGVYEEKIRLDQDNVTIVGESRDSTIVQFNIVRTDWNKNKDHIGHAVINLNGDDIILKNLTVINTQPEVGPHAFAIYGTGTRTILLNCKVISKGGDTVSLWNYKHGMYYHANCHFEGAVDFVCPRGWCYITNSTFYQYKATASLWHAGITEESQKFVLANCSFDGVEGFQLGRHHYEAQFYLLNCNFSKDMADTPIYKVTYQDQSRNRPYFWGDRHYYYQCQKEGGNYNWFNDNLTPIKPENISPKWTFDNKWDPEEIHPPRVINFTVNDSILVLYFNETVSVRENPELITATGKTLQFTMGQGRKMLQFSGNEILEQNDFKNEITIKNGEIVATLATVNERKLESKIKITKKL